MHIMHIKSIQLSNLREGAQVSPNIQKGRPYLASAMTPAIIYHHPTTIPIPTVVSEQSLM